MQKSDAVDGQEDVPNQEQVKRSMCGEHLSGVGGGGTLLEIHSERNCRS